jgi:hypothetical protein
MAAMISPISRVTILMPVLPSQRLICGDQAQTNHSEAEIEIMQGRIVALRMEDDRADRTRSGEKRRSQRHHRHRIALGGIEFFFPGLTDVAHLGIEHGNRHQQDEDAAADPERPHRDTEKTENGLTGEQHHQ